MALSNWDTLAFDHEAQPCNGVIEGFKGGSARIYKNWVYVSDTEMWVPGRSFSENTIAHINSGDLSLSEFEIVAERHEPQQAVFVLVSCRPVDGQGRWMAGIGCSGYTDRDPAIYAAAGIKIEEWDDCWVGTSYKVNKEKSFTISCFKNDEMTHFEIPYNETLESQWVGVLPETLEAFFVWLESVVDRHALANYPNREWIAECRKNGGLRFNQGDAYFAKAGVGVLDSTVVGNADAPLAMQMIKKMDD